MAKLHHSQLPEMPRVPTTPATYRGVSMENVVAAMDVPTSHQGSARPPTKKSTRLPDARRARWRPSARVAAR
jgi:hypothetical protein